MFAFGHCERVDRDGATSICMSVYNYSYTLICHTGFNSELSGSIYNDGSCEHTNLILYKGNVIRYFYFLPVSSRLQLPGIMVNLYRLSRYS